MKSTDEGTLLSCDLVVVVDNLVHKESTNSFFVKPHILKKHKSINECAAESNIYQAIPHYFNDSSVPVENVTIVYLKIQYWVINICCIHTIRTSLSL